VLLAPIPTSGVGSNPHPHLKVKNMKYFTADWHLQHGNIIPYCNRPFKDANQMDTALFRNSNEIVEDTDEIWNLGDVTMKSAGYAGSIKKLVERFKGHKHLVLGNHDNWKMHNYLEIGFETIHSAMWFEHADWKFVLVHDPALYTVFENSGDTIVLCGHIHRLFKHLLPEKRIINVGVDVWDYYPVSMTSILELIKQFELEPA
jgi:calcineurin-like phosphoesterase family protein